ncbi:hypothetical protein BH747_08490 [Enterococcus villorum]|uniref:WxL domain-containing protein n=1 Tax=Enterococcus villorum TaxID=112904 RepID=A0A1V8YBH2_9ENTE|nr:hypothetical protein [Enterococcus villorum]OQO69939.1 hypothetical protein BH747_08490 [Enterococcus villorum]OQO76391.1 hypothetical protein BH744_03000 [Enterococcus villorum]
MKKSICLISTGLCASFLLVNSIGVSAASTTINPAPSTAETPITAPLLLPDNGGSNPTPPSNTKDPASPTDPGNKSNNPTVAFGIAYEPGTFTIPSTKLVETGSQTINVTMPKNSGTFDIGVKDKTRDTKGWTLKAQVVWDNAEQGMSIQTGHTGTNAKVNTGGGNLVDAPAGSITAAPNVEITSGAQALLMTGTQGFIHNDTYDYDLGQVALKIANAKTTTADNHTGHVEWNLAVTP